MKNSILSLMIAVLAIAGCRNFHEAEFVEVNELLPVDEDMVIVDAVGGEASLKFYATGKVRAYALVDTDGWAEVLSPSRFDGDGTVSVRFDRNRSYRRMVPIRLVLEDKGLEDTLYFKQKGVEPMLACDAPYTVVDGSQDSKVTVTLNTNVVRADLNMEIDYPDGDKEWIDGLAFTGDIEWDADDFVFRTKASETDVSSRAVVRVWFDDLWNEDVSVTLYITRTGRNGVIGTQVPLQDIRTRTEPFAKDEYIEGYVVSDCRSVNMAENPNTSYDKVDLSESERTAYITTQDGSCGLRLIFDNAKDNVLKPGMKLILSLDGLRLQKKQSPECFTLSGISIANLLKVENGFEIAPKIKTISQLVPEDIYTYVTLTDVEFINKAGTYSNIYEGYDFFDSWGSLLADAEGSSIFAPVNASCNWRRTGTGVPQGAGTVSGIIVSENLKRFGNAGDYQIRVVDESAFDMDGQSVLSEFHRWNGNASDISFATIKKVANFSGKTMANNGMLNSTATGCSVSLSDWYNFDEHGVLTSTNGLVINLSTKGQTGRILTYISFLAWGMNGTYRVAPAHWELQYSVDGGEFKTVKPSVKAVAPTDYVHLRPGPSDVDYHNGRKYFPSIYMANGFCDVIYLLPEDASDKENVKVRFAPCMDGVLFDFPAEASDFADDIEGNTMEPTSQYNGEIHFAEISFKTINK